MTDDGPYVIYVVGTIANPERDALIRRIATGEEQLFSMLQICNRLGISYAQFNRYDFPPPDIHTGNVKRWTATTFKRWLKKKCAADVKLLHYFEERAACHFLKT